MSEHALDGATRQLSGSDGRFGGTPSAAGPAIPAIESIGYDNFCDLLRSIVTPLHDAHTGVRIISQLGWATARPS